MTTRKTVLFLIPHLGGGGAERVLVHLAAGLAAEKFQVHVGVVSRGSWSNIHLPAGITVHTLGAGRVRFAFFPLLRLVWSLKPDLIYSGIYHLNFLVLALRPLMPRGTRCIVRQNGLTGAAEGTNRRTRLLYRILYPRAESIVCQTETMAAGMSVLLRNSTNIRVLPNPVMHSFPALSHTPEFQQSGPQPHLLAVGRLVKEKGFDLLLTAFAKVKEQFPQAHLTILGKGVEEASLKAMSHQLGIDASVSFPGYVDHPEEWFPKARLFVLSSRQEAMPNALLEAASYGLPIVATPALGDSTAGLRGMPGCWVAEECSAQALAESLCEALNTLNEMQRVEHDWIEPFRMENALRRHEALIDEVLAGARA